MTFTCSRASQGDETNFDELGSFWPLVTMALKCGDQLMCLPVRLFKFLVRNMVQCSGNIACTYFYFTYIHC